MRTLSAAAMKGNTRSLNRSQKIPREGTRIRGIFDTLMQNRGVTVTLDSDVGMYVAKEQLQNFYGLDIRRFGKKKWCLVGEWYGAEYIDYFAETLKQEKDDVKSAKLGQALKGSRRSHRMAQEATV